MRRLIQSVRRKSWRTILVLLVGTMIMPSRTAKAPDSSKAVKQYLPKLLTVTDGLPQPWVQTIAQTSDGYMWFGTQEGLSRFNGTQFRNFDKNNTPGINHNNIRVLLLEKTSPVESVTELVRYSECLIAERAGGVPGADHDDVRAGLKRHGCRD